MAAAVDKDWAPVLVGAGLGSVSSFGVAGTIWGVVAALVVSWVVLLKAVVFATVVASEVLVV